MRKCIYISLMISLIIIELYAGIQNNTPWLKVYFTSPGKRISGNVGKQNPETGLLRLIENAKKSYNGAFYDISSGKIARALIKAYKRGVDVKLVAERDNTDKKGMKMIRESGIEVVTDNRHGLMHNKFAIVDSRIVWTGSYNLTYNGAYKNNNNAIEIHSARLADIFHEEFTEMFEYKIFGNKKENRVFSKLGKKYYVKIEDVSINAYFSPDDDVERIIVKKLKKARESIHFMAFSFTSDSIGEEIISRFKDGVKVHGIFERHGAKSSYSEYIKMKIEGVPVKLDRNRYVMHHKVIIIDGICVITGSFNFSKNANKKNDENILMIDSHNLSRKYLNEFYKLYQ